MCPEHMVHTATTNLGITIRRNPQAERQFEILSKTESALGWGRGCEPQVSNPCHLYTWPEACRREGHVSGIRKSFGDVGWRVELCIIDLLRRRGVGGGGSCGRSIQLEPPPAHDHRLILIPRQARQHAAAAAWKEGLTDLPIFADCSAVLRISLNFQIGSNQVRCARSCWKS